MTSPAEDQIDGVAQLRLKELVDAVVERTGQRKGEVRQTLLAALEHLGESLGSDRDLQLPGLGKARVTRRKSTERGEVLMVRLMQPKGTEDSADEGLAPGEQGR